MTKKRFKESLTTFSNAKQSFEESKQLFELEVMNFMKERGIPVRILFFGNTFGLDIRADINNWREVPRKIPLNVLTDFCNEFGCEFEYTNCDGERYIFSFQGLSVGFNL